MSGSKILHNLKKIKNYNEESDGEYFYEAYVQYLERLHEFHKDLPFLPVPKNIRLNSTQYFIIKIPKKQELQQMVFNHSSDVDFKV